MANEDFEKELNATEGINGISQKDSDKDGLSDSELVNNISELGYSEYTRLQDFITLTQKLKAKQDALDIMAADTTPSAILTSYVADTLEPNSQGDLVTLVAKDPGNQPIIDNIYKRLNIPLDKVVYSLCKNAIAIAEFAHEGDLNTNKPSSVSATESQASATEDIMVKVNTSKLYPKLRILSDTTRVFPILKYESVIGFIEVTLDDYANFDFSSDIISYKDVVIHPIEDYVYVKFGYRTESNPLTLRVKGEDGEILEYEIDQGRSLLESAFPAWQTLSIMRDAINLARLAHSSQAIIIESEVGNMTEAQIELARNKLKDLFENRLAIGRNGAKSYLQPQVKPNYIYVFKNNGVGAITANTVGGEYNPGVLTDLQYFEDEFFGGMGAVKQHFARTSDSAGLDGGGAVEQYQKRYLSNVAQYKRLLASFIKKCINQILLSRGLLGVYNNFDVIINKSYEEDDVSIINFQNQKLGLLKDVIDFMGIQDQKELNKVKLQAIKTVITDKTFLESLTEALLESPNPGNNSQTGGGDSDSDSGDDLAGLGGGGGGGGLMDQIDTIGTDEDTFEDEGLGDENGEEPAGEPVEPGEPEPQSEETSGELPPVSDIVNPDEIDEA